MAQDTMLMTTRKAQGEALDQMKAEAKKREDELNKVSMRMKEAQEKAVRPKEELGRERFIKS